MPVLLSDQRGSVLLWILIAVVLMAGLTFAMNQGSRSSGSAVTDQQARLAATEIVAYAGDLSQAVQKLLLSGCSENGLQLSNTVWVLTNGTPNTPSNPNAPPSGCSVFNPAEGGMVPIIFPVSYTNKENIPVGGYTTLGHARIFRTAIPGVGVEGKEELNYVLARLDKKICMEINKLLDVPNDGALPPPYVQGSPGNYLGTFADTASLTDTNGAFTGKTAFCARQNASTFDFWQVLHVR